MNDEKAVSVKEKKRVAFVSVFAAIFLTGFKLIIGLITGSLGLLSEALHSGLDLVAATITYFAVRISDKPSDKEHHFGHGKIENLSALIETLLLLVTCVWIIYEAVNRLVTGKVEIDIMIWSYVVVITSIVVDYSRSTALYKAAKKHNSQALEADALHFSTDIWSSLVVLFGLVGAQFGYHFADSIAALFVALIVIYVSYRLGKKSINVLLDRAPAEIPEQVKSLLKDVSGVIGFHDLRVREGGAQTFIEVNIHVDPQLTVEQAHQISHKVEEHIGSNIKNCTVHVHQEPNTKDH